MWRGFSFAARDPSSANAGRRYAPAPQGAKRAMRQAAENNNRAAPEQAELLRTKRALSDAAGPSWQRLGERMDASDFSEED